MRIIFGLTKFIDKVAIETEFDVRVSRWPDSTYSPLHYAQNKTWYMYHITTRNKEMPIILKLAFDDIELFDIER